MDDTQELLQQILAELKEINKLLKNVAPDGMGVTVKVAS